MNSLRVAVKSIRSKALHTLLSVLILGFGCGMIMLVLSARDKVEEQFKKNIRNVDMVVGAKGSPLQLILSSVYHIDAPTGNIPLAEFQKVAGNPLVEQGIPLSYGDNYKGYRILGTDSGYFELYKLQLAEGKYAGEHMSTVVGARVAQAEKLKVGQTFEGSHGLDEKGEEHHAHPYKVAGILEPCNCVADKLIITPLESVWEVHAHDGEADHEKPKEITAGLLAFKSPMAQVTLPRMINANTSMQAALPSIELNRLFSLLGNAISFVSALAVLLLVLAAVSVFISLYQNLRDEEPQMAYLRAIGAGRGSLFSLIILKGLMISVLGYLVGLILNKAGMIAISASSQAAYKTSLQFSAFNSYDFYVLLATIAVGILASVLPAIRAYKLNISKTLADA